MKKDKYTFFYQICSFTEIKIYDRIISDTAYNVTRKRGQESLRINKYFFRQNRIIYFFSKLLPQSLKKIIANLFISLNFFNDPVILDKDNKDNKDKFFDYYREDNVLLANDLNKDLKTLGYLKKN